MNELTLNSILRQIVVDMAPIPGVQINTYVLTDRDPDMNNQSFGMTYEQFDAGYFWSRSWVGAGMKRSDFCGQFPVMFVEPGPPVVECSGDSEAVFAYNILVVDEVGCKGCPDHDQRSPRQVAANVRSMILAFVKELSSYGTYIILDPETDVESTVWMSEGRAASMAEFDPALMSDIIGSTLEPNGFSLQEWGNHPDRRGYYITLRFRWCPEVSSDFDYQTKTPGPVGVINCPC